MCLTGTSGVPGGLSGTSGVLMGTAGVPHEYCTPSWVYVLRVCLTGTLGVPQGYCVCASQVLRTLMSTAHTLYRVGGI